MNGAPVELLAKDTGEASSTAAETGMSELVTAGVDAVVGPASSRCSSSALLPVVTGSGIPMISPAATLPDLTDLDDHGLVFRTIPSYEQQGYALADALAGTKVALVVLDDAMGGLLADTADDGAGSATATVRPRCTFPPRRPTGPRWWRR